MSYSLDERSEGTGEDLQECMADLRKCRLVLGEGGVGEFLKRGRSVAVVEQAEDGAEGFRGGEFRTGENFHRVAAHIFRSVSRHGPADGRRLTGGLRSRA